MFSNISKAQKLYKEYKSGLIGYSKKQRSGFFRRVANFAASLDPNDYNDGQAMCYIDYIAVRENKIVGMGKK